MTINALNSGARVWLADLEDASTPHWDNVVGGQANLRDAIRREVDFTSPDGKRYALHDGRLATIVMRPRGWHLDERNVQVDGEPVAGALVDFGLYFFHNAAELLARGSGPYFYLPKMESHLEARLWNDVFVLAQDELGIPHGSVRATVLIETIPAAFEMEEILYELRDHASGLNAGRWDYLFSIIKWFRDRGPDYVLPDRSSVGMTAPFMKAYAEQLVKTCHKRGAFAIGGMSAFIPSRHDAEVNERAFAQVRADKEREASQGFDGSWVAHPDLVPAVRRGVRRGARRPDRTSSTVSATTSTSPPRTSSTSPRRPARSPSPACAPTSRSRSATSSRGCAGTAPSRSTTSWRTRRPRRSRARSCGSGSATARRSLSDGTVVTADLVRRVMDEEMDVLGPGLPAGPRDLREVALADEYVDFLTLPAYEVIQ